MIRPAGLFPKYAAALMLFVAFIVVGSGAIQLALIYREVREAAAAVQQAEARAAAVRIDQFLTSIRSVVAEAGALPWDSTQLQGRDRREEYHRVMKLQPAISELRWVDSEGRERMKLSRFGLDEAETMADSGAGAEVAEALRKGFEFGQPYFRDGSEPFVRLAVRNRGREPSATVADIDLKFVADLVKQIQLGTQGRIYVVDRAGRLVAHPNLDLVLRNTALSDYAPLSQLRAAIEEKGGGVAGMIEGEGLESGPVLISGASIASLDWTVIAEEPRAEVMAPVTSAVLRTGLLLLGGLLTALLVSYWLAHRLSRPILQVRDGAAKLARGDLSARIDVRTGDEVEALATQFNEMAGQIQDYTIGLERKVDERTAELRAAMRTRALFLAAASHDLRQPLYAISILADTLALEPLSPAARDGLAKQREAIAVLRGLFDNLLDLSRFDSGEIRVNPRVVALREILSPITIEHEVVCRAKGLEWRSEIADVWVNTDPELIRRITTNLLSNAVRYTVRGSVSLVAQAEGAKVRIEVSDTGRGIAPHDQGRIFEEFVQLDNPSRERDRGVGLGLSIVKKISELLGANLTLRSAVGEGTRVSVEIPLAEMSALREREEAADAPSVHAFAGLRVWAVEDDPLVRDALAAQFAAWGVDHAFAVNRPEIESLLESDGGWPDAAMLDDMLGQGVRGLDIARWMQAEMPKERIVLVTGNVEPQAAQALADSGFTVLRKPLSSALLAQWLHEATRSPRAATAGPAGARAG